jgi:hypothetical protein
MCLILKHSSVGRKPTRNRRGPPGRYVEDIAGMLADSVFCLVDRSAARFSKTGAVIRVQSGRLRQSIIHKNLPLRQHGSLNAVVFRHGKLLCRISAR